jgi:UDP-N-acetylmuramate--alanine ligase
MIEDVEDLVHAHFIGIGGAGMSGIAKVLIEMGYKVSGSDLKESRYTKALIKYGAVIALGHRSENIEDPNVVVVSTAIPETNPELHEARRKNIPVVRRAEMLAWVGKQARSIAVAGTHGKTTTTSMISLVFEKANLDPTFLIGGELNDIGSNAKYGGGEFFITEADESDGSLLFLNPEIVVLTNIEADHLDYYGSLQEIEDLFCRFIESIPERGFVIACSDDSGVCRLINRSDKRFITYGIESTDFTDRNTKDVVVPDYLAKNVILEQLGSSFEVYKKGEFILNVRLSVPGIHNVYNALATIALCEKAAIDLDTVVAALGKFSGVKRRFQIIGSTSEFTIVDDYAHHPTEVKATLNAAKSGDWQRLICVFQPHRYSRTKFLGKEFGPAFSEADIVVLTDVYAAGEEPIPGITGKVIVDAVLSESPRKQVVYLPKKTEIPKFLMNTARKGDLILTMGAGDISATGEEFLSLIER